MDGERFDAVARTVSSRLTRRGALGGAGAGLVGGLAGVASLGVAAHGVPETPAGQPTLSDDASFLFVQSATGGTFAANPGAGTPSVSGTPTPGGGADYLLTLSGHTGHTVYFSDRPERIFGEAPTQAFLDGLGFGVANPPNAALVTSDEQGNEDILVVELIEPAYDAVAGSITYGVNILSDYEGGLGFAASRQRDEDLAPSFGEASLFIDDCSDSTVACINYYESTNQQSCLFAGSNLTVGYCWSWTYVSCQPCNLRYDDQCRATYPIDCGDDCIGVGNASC